MRASTEIVGENMSAQQKNPKRKDEKAPLQIRVSKQKEQSQPVTKEADVAGREPGIDGNRRDRKHEHPRHLDGVDIHEIGYQRPRERKHPRIEFLRWGGAVYSENSGRHCCGRKEHSKEQEAASEKHGSKKSVFALTQPITQHTNQPQKC